MEAENQQNNRGKATSLASMPKNILDFTTALGQIQTTTQFGLHCCRRKGNPVVKRRQEEADGAKRTRGGKVDDVDSHRSR